MPPKHHHKHHGPGRGHDHHGPGRGRGRGRGHDHEHDHHHHKHHHDHHHKHHSDSESERSRSHSPPHHHHDHDHHHHHHHHHHDHHHPHEHHDEPPPPRKEEEEKKDNNEDEQAPDVSNLEINDNNAAAKEEEAAEEVAQPEMGQTENTTDDKKKKKYNNANNNKNQFKVSPKYGGDGGVDQFDHGAHKHISKITMYTNGHVVCGIEIMYLDFDGQGPKMILAGKKEDHEATSFHLEKNEFITWAKVRSNKFVQELTFRTNKGKMLGPVGGQGWGGLMSKDRAGDEVEVAAPFKKQLCGIIGASGWWIDNIAFRWGPVPEKVLSGN